MPTKETYLRWQTTFLLDSKVNRTIRAQGEYQVMSQVDGILISEIKGWIKHQHKRYAGIGYLPCEVIPVKTSRPKPDVECYTTKLDRGCWKGKVETMIVKIEKEIESPQMELF